MAKPVIPISVAKAHLRVEHDLDDELIGGYLEAAVDHTLQEIGLAGVLDHAFHVTETTLREFGFLYPVASVTKVEKKDSAGAWQVVPTDQWTLSGNLEERHVMALSEDAGHHSVSDYKVTWVAGLEPLPAWFRVACLFLIGHYYENRSSVVIGSGVTPVEVPMGFVHLTKPHKRWFFA